MEIIELKLILEIYMGCMEYFSDCGGAARNVIKYGAPVTEYYNYINELDHTPIHQFGNLLISYDKEGTILQKLVYMCINEINTNLEIFNKNYKPKGHDLQEIETIYKKLYLCTDHSYLYKTAEQVIDSINECKIDDAKNNLQKYLENT